MQNASDMKEELFIPISRTGEAVVRSRCAFESARAAYDYACFKGFVTSTTKQVLVSDMDSYLVLDRMGIPTRVISSGDSYKVTGAYDDWYICDNGSLFFQRMNGEFFEIPQSRTGSPGLINEVLEMGDDFKFRNFMYAYLRVLHDRGISEVTVKTEAYPDDNS